MIKNALNVMNNKFTLKKKTKQCGGVGIYRWEPAPPELTLSASLVAAEASDRLEPDWALLKLSAM